MSDYIDDGARCDEFRDDLAELALGVLSGRRRAEVLGHLETCPHCTAELEQLSLVADSLLQLSLELEPPLGFESRLASRLHETSIVKDAYNWRRICAGAVAASVLVLAGFGVGAIAGPHDTGESSVSSANLASAPLLANGKSFGEVMISAGSPAWVFMAVDGGVGWSRVTCEVTLASGKIEMVGAFQLSGGYGAWGAPLSVAGKKIRSARLVTSSGTVLASAAISA